MPTRHDADPKALLAARRREVAKPGRHKATGRGSGLTPKVKAAIEYIVFGKDGAWFGSMEAAAEAAGISGRTLWAAMLKPAVDAFYSQQLTAYRNGQRAASIRTIAEIRDDPGLKATAAGQNVRLKAADTLAFDKPGMQVVNHTQINNVSVTPGYVIDLTPDDDEERLHVERTSKTIDVESGEVAVYTRPK
jgi:hypothetical protein